MNGIHEENPAAAKSFRKKDKKKKKKGGAIGDPKGDEEELKQWMNSWYQWKQT